MELMGELNYKKGLLFVGVNEFREAIKDFIIYEGIEIVRAKNGKRLK